ncbi:outer membrane lipoprotein carrier protein LolA [Candidatus Binatus sp.]|uniref:outer membrane lipoprotein carrier protein LolA n=1 Tax=Candidatus Binatus sp. TaxID=2811406 RepID=UPI002FDB345E
MTLTSVCFAELAMGPTLAAGQTLHGRFVEERHLKGLSSTLKSEGSFVLAPGKGLIWRMEQPIQTLTVITPAAIRQIIDGSEVQHIDAARVPFIAHFYDMLNGSLIGDWSAMRHDFVVKSTGDRQAWRTVLTPLQPDDPIAGMLASIVISGGKMVDSVDINRTNGDSEHMAFLDQKVSNVPLVGEEARLLDSRPAS